MKENINNAPKDITLNQIRYFVRTADLESMTETAAEFFVAQSAISTAISQLERSVGHTLFLRLRSRGVTLTDQGKTFYAYARGILNSVDEALNSLHPESLTGTLAAGFYRTLAPFWLPQVFEDIAYHHPELEILIREVDGDQIEHLLHRREIEMAFAYNFDYGQHTEFDPITEAPIYAGVSEKSPLALRQSVTLDELAKAPLILLNLGKSANYFLSIFHEAQLRPRVHQRFESFEVVRAMVARGHGYTILNQRPTHDLAPGGGRIVRLPIEGVTSHLQVGIVRRAGEPTSRKAQVFTEACRTALASDIAQ